MKEHANKRIAFYIGSLAKGGAERVITNLAQYFNENGYNVAIVTKLKEDDEYIISDKITRVIADITKEEETKSRLINLYRRIHKLRRIFKEINPDVILSFIGKNNLMAIAATRFLKIPVYVSVRSAPKRELGGKGNTLLTFFLFSFAKGVILQTKEAKAFFPKFIQKKAVVLPNSLNPRFLRPYYQMERKKTIVSVGRLDDNKNQQMLIAVFERLSKEYPDWKLEIYGDGENYGKLEKMIEDKQLKETVYLRGNQPNIESLIEAFSIYVLTSKIEGMPNALMEAMSLGLAVVSTNCPCGGPAELIEHEKNGLLIPVDDKESLYQALKRLIEDKAYREQLSKEAFRTREKFQPKVVNKAWSDYLLH